MNNNPNILIYQNENGNIKVDVMFEDGSIWLSQAQICELFGKAKSTISEHIKAIFEEGELDEEVVVRNYRTTTFSSNSPSSKIAFICSLIVDFALPNTSQI